MQNHLNSMMARATTFQKLDKAEQKRYARKHIMHHKNATKDRRTGFTSAKAYEASEAFQKERKRKLKEKRAIRISHKK
jgi:hypothetical protein